MIKKASIPTILGILLLVAGTFTGVLLLGSSQIFKIGADVNTSPKNIRTSNISDASTTISWTTDKETLGYVVWGNSKDDVSKVANEDSGSQKYFNHSVTINGLSPNTTYYYKINSDGTMLDNGGIPWQIATGPILDSNKNSVILSGTVINASGQPEKRALVYADLSGYLLSTFTSETGNYVFQIANARTTDLKSYIQVDPAQTLVQLSVQATPDGVSSAQIYPQSGNPAPALVIGQVYDFRNAPTNTNGVNPSANINLPQDETKTSKFNVFVPESTQKPTTVILESLVEGETVTTDQPQFFGKGPSGATLTITVHSQNPITTNIEVPKTGSWNYAVPTNLEPGNHTVTISWMDISGITRSLTRGFVVQAGQVPAFSASGSGTTPSPSPVASIAPSTFAPSPTAIPTNMPVPVTGDVTPTLFLSMIGIAVLAFAITIWKFSET
jgi:hypothetical protein